MDHRHELVPGTLLDRKYRIERVIGVGGFGITYAAIDFGLATEVAIKEYYPTQFAMRDSTLSIRPVSDFERPLFDRMRSSFLREARTLARFDHPGIVRVLNVFEAHGTAYMVMKLETGPSLKTWRAGLQRRPTQDEIDMIASHLLDALEVMHAATFLHRDVAPDNVIIRSDGSPVILDFGATRRVMGEASGALTGIVKRGYSPQEQYSSDSRGQGPWTDIYSLAGTFYYAITGTQPTDATERMLEDRLSPLSSLERGNYRADFLDAIDWGMQLRPEARPQSIAAWRERMFRMHAPLTSPPLRESTRPNLLRPGPDAALEQPTPGRAARPRTVWIGGAAALVIAGVVAGALMLQAGGLLDSAIAPSANVARRDAEPAADQAKKLTERLALEAGARREREAAELKAREDAARIAAEAAARQQREAAELKAREEAARIAAEAAARQQREAAELKAREDAARIAAEAAARQQREAAELKAREEAARIAAEAAARQQREAAERKPAITATEPQTVPESQRKLVAGIRGHLNRVGCHTAGTAPGWTTDDQKALERFVKYAGTAFTFTQLNDEVAEAVGSYVGRVCPSQCGPNETAGVDRCVAAPAQAIAVRCSQINDRAQLGLLTEEDRDTLRSGRCRN